MSKRNYSGIINDLNEALDEIEDDREAAEADMLADRFRDEGW